MSAHDPIAYTYDAAHHCRECAIEYVGGSAACLDSNSAEDSEGNGIGAVFPWDEWWQTDGECDILACDTCHAVLENAHAADCEEFGGDHACTIREEFRV